MKFDCKLPGGWEIHFERETMESYKFYTLCWAICLAIVLPAFFSIWK